MVVLFSPIFVLFGRTLTIMLIVEDIIDYEIVR